MSGLGVKSNKRLEMRHVQMCHDDTFVDLPAIIPSESTALRAHPSIPRPERKRYIGRKQDPWSLGSLGMLQQGIAPIYVKPKRFHVASHMFRGHMK